MTSINTYWSGAETLASEVGLQSMCIYIFIYTYIYICIHIYLYIQIYTYVHMYMYIIYDIYKYILIRSWVAGVWKGLAEYMYIHIFIYIYIHMYTSPYVYIQHITYINTYLSGAETLASEVGAQSLVDLLQVRYNSYTWLVHPRDMTHSQI